MQKHGWLRFVGLTTLAVLAGVACGDDSEDTQGTTGGATGSGGLAATGGAVTTGGLGTTGGLTNTGGVGPTTGGVGPTTGGVGPSGGAAPTGGVDNTGGFPTGGVDNTGGLPTGGVDNTGGLPTGGVDNTGGNTTGGVLSTGGTGGVEDPFAQARIDCVARINGFRATEGLAPLEQWVEAESCLDEQAMLDAESGVAHDNFGMCDENAQNTCPGWGSVDSIIQGCLQSMWDEGPGDFNEGHGHYINMSNPDYTQVACGFYVMDDGDIWASQDFR